MGSSNFEVNLPSLFGKKMLANFELDSKFFEFSEYFLIDSYLINCTVEIEKKNAFWQLDLALSGSVKTYCDRCGDPLVLSLHGLETYFLKKEIDDNSQSHNIIYLNHTAEPVNLEGVIKEAIFFLIPRTKKHKTNECNPEAIEKLEFYQKGNNKNTLSDHLKKKLKK